ncbi:hypothetical protein A6R68_22533, partial [Neotoma lepida]
GGQVSRVPEHRELRLEQLPEVSATIERGPRAPPAGRGRFQDGSGPECRREGEAGAPERPGEPAGSGPAGGAQSRAAQISIGNVVKTMQFEPSTMVYDACRMIRERIPEALAGPPSDFGLFLSDDDPKKGIWLEAGKALDYYMLRNGASPTMMNIHWFES